ncbi:uncharacterized protein [Cherax quadricarinatus]
MLAGLLGLAAATVTTTDVSELDHDVKTLSPSESEERIDAARRQERLFAFLTTTSVKRLATTTITALSTCLSVGTTACNGRKKRNGFREIDSLEQMVPELTGTQVDEKVEIDEEGGNGNKRGMREVVNNRDGKKLTIWSTYVSTLTLTSTSYVAGTTITVSALCVAPGITAGCFGK